MTVLSKGKRASPTDSRPIGVFDSGVGGLTVAKKMFRLLPNENIIYFGDTGRYPYGPRSDQIVRKFSFQNVSFLLRQKVKLIVIACNTASAVALGALRKACDVPMIGVVEPGARAALRATVNGRIGVIGTLATINSKAYQKAILRARNQLKVYALPCPLFVSLAEEGYINKKATHMIASEYLDSLIRKRVDTLVLGCTHYPLLKGVISRVMEEKVMLIDSAEETAKEVARLLRDRDLLRDSRRKPYRRFFVSDIPDRFIQVGERFLKGRIGHVKRIDIDRY
jgi:glutamate racemase